MSLQDAEKENLLRAFYRERLLPLAESAKTAGVEIFPLGADRAAESYYLERSDGGNYVHEINSGDLAGELKDLWSAGKDSLPGLAKLAEEIVALAETLRESEDTFEEVSPFIYAMF